MINDLLDSHESHKFLRINKPVNLCTVCQDLWASSDGLVSKFYQCMECGISCHSSCKSIAQSLPCPLETSKFDDGLDFETNSISKDISLSLNIQCLRAYDLPSLNGNAVYYICRPSNGLDNQLIRGTSVNCNDAGEIVFDINEISKPLLFHLKANDHFIPTIIVEIWKSFLSVFDNKVASCNINILPLVRLSNYPFERWFPLYDIEGKHHGNILLRISSNVIVQRNENVKSIKISDENHPNANILLSDSNELKKHEKLQVKTISQEQHTSNEKTSNSHLDPTIKIDSSKVTETIISPKVSPMKKMLHFENDMNPAASFIDVDLNSRLTTGSIDATVPYDSNVVEMATNMVSNFVTGSPSTNAINEHNSTTTNASSNSSQSNITNSNEWSKYAASLGSTASGIVDSIYSVSTSSKLSEAQQMTQINELLHSNTGYITVDLVSAFKYDVSDSGEGNHFITATINDLNLIALKSKIVYNSATPIFNIKWKFMIPHFHSYLKLSLMELPITSNNSIPSGNNKLFTSLSHNHGKCIGESYISLYSLIQKDADAFNYYLHQPLKMYENIPIRDIHDKDKIIGHFIGKIQFTEDTKGLYFSMNPKIASSSPSEQLSLDRLTIHIARFQALMRLYDDLIAEYNNLVKWKDVTLTFFVMISFVLATIYINAEYAFCCPLFIIIIILTKSMLRRRSGLFKQDLVAPFSSNKSKHSYAESNDGYQPYAVIRMSVLAFKSKSVNEKSLRDMKRPSVKVSYVYANSLSLYNYKAYINAATSDSDNTLRDQLLHPRELLVGYFSGSRSGWKESRSQFEKIMSSLNITNLIGSNERSPLFQQAEVLYNNFDPWPYSKVIQESIGSHDRKKEADKAIICEFKMKDISLVYPCLQDIRPRAKKSLQANQQPKNSNIMDNIKNLSIDLSDSQFIAKPDVKSNPSIPLSKSHDEDTTIHESSSWNYNTEDSISSFVRFVPWEKSDSYLKFEIYNDELIPFGIVRVPIRDLVNRDDSEEELESPIGKQTEILKWFHVMKPNQNSQDFNGKSTKSKQHYPMSLSSTGVASLDYSKGQKTTDTTDSSTSIKMMLRLQLDIKPGQKSSEEITSKDKDASMALQHISFNIIEESKGGSSTITALWNLRDYISYVQNLMSWILDLIESFKNILNWTSPQKTLFIYFMIIILWIITIFIPGRYLVLIVGLYQFLYNFLPDPDGKQMSIRLHNLLQSLPNDDDLTQIYQEDKKQSLEAHRAQTYEKIKRSTLSLATPCFWDGDVLLKLSGITNNSGPILPNSNLNSNINAEWSSYHLVLQGSRLVWWQYEGDISNGQKECKGQLLLLSSNNTTNQNNDKSKGIGNSIGGISGITQTSPVDIKEMKDSKRLLAIFGCDEHSVPLKCTIFFKDANSCQEFQKHITSILTR